MVVKIREQTIAILRCKIPYGLQTMEIVDTHLLSTDLLMDSIVFFSILVELEQIFDISFDVAVMDAAQFETVGSLVAYITERLYYNSGGGS